MLVLTRREDQRISIGPDITVTVCRVYADGSVRIGIEAPRHIQVVRDDAVRKAPRTRQDAPTDPPV